jgi:hypothetical protein
MSAYKLSLFLLLCLSLTCTSLHARVWTSLDGSYQWEAELVSFSDELVVLKQPSGNLVAIELKELSTADREFVALQDTRESAERSAEELQTWTSTDGMKVRGLVLAYGKSDLIVQRKLGKITINGKNFSMLDDLHQRLVLRIISKLESTQLTDEKSLEAWGKSLGANPKVYPLEGVRLRLESGDEIGVPFFMFSAEDLAVLKPGWENWLSYHESEQNQERESFLVRSAAIAYQNDRAAKQQIEMMKLSLLAAATGVVEIWQVGLAPAPGTYGRPLMVMVPAENSSLATAMALRQNPGYVLLAVRRASR